MHHHSLTSLVRILFILLPFYLAEAASAQQFLVNTKHWTVEDGLPHREVNVLVKDQRGFIWAGTPEGLCRVNGHNLQRSDKKSEGFQNSDFHNILEDAEGYFWLIPKDSSYSDFDIWHPVTRELSSFRKKFGEQARLPVTAPENWSRSTENGSIVAALSEPAILFNYHPANGLQYKPIAGAEHLELVAVEEDTWVLADDSRVLKIDNAGNIVKEVWQNASGLDANLPIENCRLPLLFQISDGLVTHAREVFVLDEQDRCRQLPGTWVAPFLVPGSRHPEIGEDLVLNGGKIVRISGELVYEIYSDWSGVRNSQFRSALIDNDGILWLGGDFGIHQIVIRKKAFQWLLTGQNNRGRFTTRGFFIKNGVLVATLDSNKPIVLRLSDQYRTELTGMKTVYDMNFVLPLSSGGFAITQNEAIYVFSDQGQLLRTYINDFNTYALAEYSPGTLFLGTADRGIQLLNLQTGETSAIDKFNGFENLGKARVSHIGSMGPQSYGLCTNKGFFIIDKNLEVQARFSQLDRDRHYLPVDNIRHFELDEDGMLWLATGEGGLLQLPTEHPVNSTAGEAQPTFRQFSREQGLSNNTLHAVYSDDYGRLWMSSDFGLMALDKKTGRVDVFLEQDGITHNEFNRYSHFKDLDGTLCFGGLNGINCFHPRDFLNRQHGLDAPIAIVSFQKFDGASEEMKDLTAELVKSNTIVLNPKDRYFQLDVSLLNYLNADKTRYAWQLTGLDDSWNLSDDHTLRFSQFPYGKYRLRVRAIDAWGRWSNSTLDIQVVALKPFYIQFWFLAMMGLLTAVAVFLFIRYKTRTYRRRQAQLEREVRQRTEVIRQQVEELRSLEQLKSRFFTNVSHELRTPLSLMLGPIDSLMKKHSGEEKELRLLKLLQGNAQHLLKLVNEILDLSKLENDKLEVAYSTVRLYDFLSPVVAQFKAYGEGERVGLEFQYQADPDLVIRIDEGMVDKILHNLLSNAFKYSLPNSQVLLKVWEEPAHLSMEVKDRGPGIHPDDLPRIFDRFFQSSRPEAQAKGGSGIGLALSKELAQLLGAEIWVETQPGKGSSFFFKLPKILPQEAMAGLHPAAPAKAESGRSAASNHLPANREKQGAPERATILLVEDNGDLREYIKLQLEEEYNLQTAENGKIAWHLLQSGSAPDLIITDLMMPEMDGAALLNLIKADDLLRHVPVIVLTARTDVQVKLDMLRIGVDDYLTKPFLEEELSVRIRNLLQHYRLRLHQHAAAEKEDQAIEKPVLSAADADWLSSVERLFQLHLAESDFNMDRLAAELAVSERQLRRRLTQLTGLSPNLYLRELRLQTARDYLQQGKYKTVKETSFAVGFSKVAHFSRLYQERFGVLPSAYFSSTRNAGRI
jgi:signal transduction histidine kinase/DNA-binding response OmpR family regulator